MSRTSPLVLLTSMTVLAAVRIASAGDAWQDLYEAKNLPGRRGANAALSVVEARKDWAGQDLSARALPARGGRTRRRQCQTTRLRRGRVRQAREPAEVSVLRRRAAVPVEEWLGRDRLGRAVPHHEGKGIHAAQAAWNWSISLRRSCRSIRAGSTSRACRWAATARGRPRRGGRDSSPPPSPSVAAATRPRRRS